MKIAIQGVPASFHDVAARKYFQTSVQNTEITQVECSTFPLLCQRLQNREADLAVMAIENSIAGSILPNYSLLEKYGFKIQGEIYLRIELNWMALPGTKPDEVRYVQSHPMALFQCENFLLSYPHVQILEGTDTAESAQEIRRRGLRDYSAIASRLAAETYGLEILQSGIETNQQNYTRFLVICRQEDYISESLANKASIRFEAADRPGSLAHVLAAFSENSVNMTKIQSIPILGRPYQYSFHVDLEWEDRSFYQTSIEKIRQNVINLVHFGEYPRGLRPEVC